MLMGVIYLKAAQKSEKKPSSGPLLDSAQWYFHKAETLHTLGKNEQELAKSRFRLGLLYLEKKDKKAIPNLEYAAEVSKKSIKNEAVAYHTKLAFAWIVLGPPSKAGKVLSDCQDMIDNGIKVSPLHKAYYCHAYSKYYEAMGEWQKASDFNEKAIIAFRKMDPAESKAGFPVRLGIMMKDLQKDLLKKMYQVEAEKKEMQISRQRLFIIIFSLSSLLVAALSYFLYRNFKKQKSSNHKNAFLVREQNHRIKNNLQVISSMLSLQNDHLSDEVSRKVLSESQARINSVALLHRQLYKNEDVGLIDIEALFDDIITSAASTFGKKHFQSSLHMDVKFIEPDIATSVGVIVNELVINSFKHAFGNRVPLIEITSRQYQRTVEITYKDFGETNIEEIFRNPEKKGFGLQLIDMILFQIDGKLKYRFRDDPAFTLTFKNNPL